MTTETDSLFELLGRLLNAKVLDRQALVDVQDWLTDTCVALGYSLNSEGFIQTYHQIHAKLWSGDGLAHLYVPKAAFDGLSLEDIRKRVAGLIMDIPLIKVELGHSKVAQKLLDVMEANDYFPKEVRE